MEVVIEAQIQREGMSQGGKEGIHQGMTWHGVGGLGQMGAHMDRGWSGEGVEGRRWGEAYLGETVISVVGN